MCAVSRSHPVGLLAVRSGGHHHRKHAFELGIVPGHFDKELAPLAEQANIQVLAGEANVVEIADHAFLICHLGHRAMVGVMPGSVVVRMADLARRRPHVVPGRRLNRAVGYGHLAGRAEWSRTAS